jgi:indole-3-glycerol phosphate synthase
MILDKIVARKKEEVVGIKKRGIQLPVNYRDWQTDQTRGFRRALLDYQGVSVIAEVKKASPSKGIICADFNPVRIAVNYEINGAQALSVLTDEDFFQGSLLFMMQAREAVSLPVLRKDFIVDPLQIDEARAHGADAILLICAILETAQIMEYKQQAEALGMDVLVEVHDEDDLQKALDADADLIGVNNRNLKDFSVDITTTFRLQKLIPEGIPVVSESGLSSTEDLLKLQEERVDAALIGETLMRAGEDSSFLKNLRKSVKEGLGK